MGQALSPANPALDQCQACGFCQAGADRVVLHIVSDAVQFRFVTHAMVEGFILRKASPVRPRIRLACRAVGPFNQRVIAGSEVLGSSST